MTNKKSIECVAIVGAGTMGRQVTWVCCAHGLQVHLFDMDQQTLANAAESLHSWFEEDLDEGAAIAAKNNLKTTASLKEAIIGADLVFENVPEILHLKQKVHREIDELAPKNVIQGTNASALVCSSVANATSRPDRFFNMNFSFPRSGEKLVEVMPNPKTSDHTMALAMDWAKTIGMIPIATNTEILGYVQNRIWRAIKKECLYLFGKGIAAPSDIDRGYVLATGASLGPFALMDKVGLDTIEKIEWVYAEESGDPSDTPPKALIEMVKAGETGLKAGKGFYNYPNPEYEREGWLEGAAD